MSIFSRLSTGKPGFGSFFFSLMDSCGCVAYSSCAATLRWARNPSMSSIMGHKTLTCLNLSILCSQLGFISNDGPNFYILGIPCLETSLEGSLNSKSWWYTSRYPAGAADIIFIRLTWSIKRIHNKSGFFSLRFQIPNYVVHPVVVRHEKKKKLTAVMCQLHSFPM